MLTTKPSTTRGSVLIISRFFEIRIEFCGVRIHFKDDRNMEHPPFAVGLIRRRDAIDRDVEAAFQAGR